MTFIYRFVRSIPYDHPVCFLDGHVKIFVSWMASLSRAPDQHQVPAQVLPSSRSRVAISSPGLSVWFPVPPSLSLSRSARSSRCVFGARSAPSASAGASFYPSSLDVVGSSRSRPRVAIWFPFLPSPSLAVGHRQIKRRPSTTPRQPPPPSPHLPGPCSVAVAIRSQLSQLAIKPARN